jgi:hypothetical protein
LGLLVAAERRGGLCGAGSSSVHIFARERRVPLIEIVLDGRATSRDSDALPPARLRVGRIHAGRRHVLA